MNVYVDRQVRQWRAASAVCADKATWQYQHSESQGYSLGRAEALAQCAEALDFDRAYYAREALESMCMDAMEQVRLLESAMEAVAFGQSLYHAMRAECYAWASGARRAGYVLEHWFYC